MIHLFSLEIVGAGLQNDIDEGGFAWPICAILSAVAIDRDGSVRLETSMRNISLAIVAGIFIGTGTFVVKAYQTVWLHPPRAGVPMQAGIEGFYPREIA